MNLVLNSIILFVNNPAELKHFYVDKLKLEVVEEIPFEWVLLKAGTCTIGLHKIGQQYLESSNNNSGSESNIKIVFETDGDLAQLRETLIKENVNLRELKTFDNYDYWLCDGEDPEGNVFQLKQKKS
jgi:catechol 2,3-dioxygenase-like lactoylglutathione lyase family enzyme